MQIHYRQINCKPFILFLAMGMMILLGAGQAKAYDDLFKVEDIKVDVTADNAVAARDLAFAKAQVDAFAVLAQRMVNDAQSTQTTQPDAATISTMIQDFEVTNEQLSNVRYIGTYTFRFDEASVSQYFAISGVQFTSESRPPLLVLPFFQEGDQIGLWSESNLWLGAWANATLQRSATPVVVPIGDLMDVADVEDSRALSYEQEGLSRLLSRYEAADAALMIAVPDAQLAAVAGDEDIAQGSLRVSLYSTDGMGPSHIQDLNFTADGMKTRAALYSEAVQALYLVLQKDWKVKTNTSSADAQIYVVSAEFTNLGEWVKIQNALSRVVGVTNIKVGSLKQSSARVTFSFSGDENYLRQMLAQNALDLGEGMPNGFDVIYSLRYSLYQPDMPEASPEPPAAPELPTPPPTQSGSSFYRPPEPVVGQTQMEAVVMPSVPDVPATPIIPSADPLNPDPKVQADEFGTKTF